MKNYRLLNILLIIIIFTYVTIKHNLINFISSNYEILLTHYSVTLSETVISIILSVLLSLTIFFISFKIDIVRNLSLNVLVVFQTIPLIVISPFLLTIFGFSILVKIIIVSILGVYPILLHIDKSYNDINKDYYVLFKLNNMNQINTTKHLILPSIFTSLFSSIKLTTSYAFSSVILTEFIGGQFGLGIYLARAIKNFDQTSIIVIVLLSVITTFGLIKIIDLIKFICTKKIYGGLA